MRSSRPYYVATSAFRLQAGHVITIEYPSRLLKIKRSELSTFELAQRSLYERLLDVCRRKKRGTAGRLPEQDNLASDRCFNIDRIGLSLSCIAAQILSAGRALNFLCRCLHTMRAGHACAS
jgi:hypothetical protein